MPELTKSQVNNIRSTYYKLNELDQKVAKAKACGIDCNDLERRRVAAMKTLQDYNNVYGAEHSEGEL